MSSNAQSQNDDGVIKMEHDQPQVDVVQQQQPQVQSEWATLRQRVEENPYDEAAWNAYVDKAEESSDHEKIKEAYEALLEKYPNTSSAQISYLNHFLANQSTFAFAESLFARFLRSSPSVDLWKFYLVYVRRVNTGPQTRDTVRKAFEFALSHVGQDKDSADIWAEYIQFVKQGETSTTWEEQQKMDALRKVYQRAVQIPLENVEILWKDYEAFENGLNRITAKKFLQDLSPAYVTARTKLRDLRKHLATLLPPPPPSGQNRPPFNLPRRPSFTPADRSLVGAWKQYLKWEESNPLDIEDKNVLMTRLQGVYRKAVIRMRFFSEIWFMAYTWTSNVGRQDEAMSILKAGIEANPTNFVLNFALAESLELAKNYPEVRSIFDRLLQGIQKELGDIEAKITVSSQQNSFSDSAMPVENVGDDSMQVDFTATNGLAKDASFVTQKTSSSASSNSTPEERELRDRKREYGLVWIMYIRFALRSEGVDSSRKIFSAARKDKWSPWEVFEAAALMEYHVAGQLPVANKIFALAHTKFPDDIEFVNRYLNFLISVNDENNARALFERAVSNFPADKARPLWEKWARHEYQYGNLEAALKLEKRMAETYPNDPPIKRFALRHSYTPIDGIASRDLGVSLSRQSLALSRTDTLPIVPVGAPGPSSASLAATASQATVTATASSTPAKRGAQSPERQPGRHAYGQAPYKRRDLSPAGRDRDREWERERDRRGGPPRDRRYGSPAAWDNRERERSPPPRRAPLPEREEPPRVVPPQVLSGFVGSLPQPNTFDGPVFRTDDLMQLLRNAVIPSRARSPPPRRPPPDYAPYRGPGPNYRQRY